MAKGCKITKNKDGKINGVLDQSGNTSKLFKEIFNTPILSLEQSIDAYKNIYGEKLKDSIRFQVIGEKGASKVEEYKTLLDEAKQLDSQNKDYSQTGWFKNDEGQWKYLSNKILRQFNLSNITLNKEQRLVEVLGEGNILFQLYPESKNLKIIYYDKTNLDISERYRGSNGAINTTSEGEATMFIRTDNPDGKDITSITAHEFQHYIQNVEGFARGGNPYTIIKNAIFITKSQELLALETVSIINNYPLNNLTSNEKKVILSARKLIADINNNDLLISQLDLLQGEIDARVVEQALKLRDNFKNSEYRYEDLLNLLQNKEGINKNEVISIFTDDIFNDTTRQTTKSADQEVIDRLKESGLAENVFQMSTAEINAKLEELGADNVQMTTLGFVFNNDVYFNSDLANNETFVHEYGHLLLSTLKTTNKATYDKGIELVSEEINNPNSEIKDIIAFIKETQPNLKGEALLEEILTETISRKAGEMMDEQKAKSPLMQWLSDFWETIGKMLGITNMTPQQIANLNLGEYATAMGVSLLQGNNIKGSQAQQYFTREADRLPLTLAVFSRPEFVKLQGKQINPLTVLNSLNQTGIKQIEKELIKNIIEENYVGQKKISYDELEATVRANIMPLERVFTSSYANYGMDNLGDGKYGTANTIILNTPIEHAITGHLSEAFKASGRKDIKYISKQLNGNTWVAVEENYQAQGANDNNIYQFVGTAGTKEAVDVWINEYESYEGLSEKEMEEMSDLTRKRAIASLDEKEKKRLEYLQNKGVNISINKGMFAHIRVWQDGDIFYVAEAQSDFYQKYKAKDLLIKEKSAYFTTKEFTKKREEFFTKQGFTPNNFREKHPSKESLSEIKTENNKKIGKYDRLLSEIRNNKDFNEVTEQIEALNVKNQVIDAYLKGSINVFDFVKKYNNNEKEVDAFIKDEKVREQKHIDNIFSPQEKQFIASQKEWEKRLLREALKEASLSGATTFRLPTPYTLSVIEGYIKDENYDSTQLPYNIISRDLEYNSETVDSNGNVVVLEPTDIIMIGAQAYAVTRADDSEFSAIKIDNEKSIQYNKEVFKKEFGEDVQIGIHQIGGVRYSYNGKGMITFISGGLERFSQPQVYLGNKAKKSWNFQISDLSDTEQTVARKYKELKRLLEIERGEENVETVTDENGFDWYETKIEASEVNNPVIAFQKAIEPNLIFETPSGQIYNTYQEALQNTNEGEIKLKIEGVVVAEVNSDTNIDTYEGLINSFVKAGGLTGERILEVNGDEILVVTGETITAKHLTANNLETIATKMLGQRSVKRTKTGDIILINNKGKRIINGKEYKENGLKEMNYEALKKEFGEDIALNFEVSREIEKALMPSKNQKKLSQDIEIKSEDELINSIKSLLTKMGVSITSIEDYVKNTSLKNEGVNMNSTALMDLVNKVMAFRDGTITRDDLIEETMHLIEASSNQESMEGVRKNIHKTPEWQQHSAHYYEVYAKEYSGDKLEEMVRREVLGKVMANAVKTNFALEENATLTQQSIFSKIKEVLDTFFQKISNYFKPEYQQQIDKLNKDLYTKLMAGQLADELNLDQEFGTKFRLYSSNKNISSDLVNIQKQAEDAINLLESYSQQTSKNDASQKKLSKTAREAVRAVSEALIQADTATNNSDIDIAKAKIAVESVAAFSAITAMAQKQLTYLQRAAKKKAQDNFYFSSEERAVYISMVQSFGRKILPITKTILEDRKNKTRAEEKVLSEIDKTINAITELEGQVGVLQINAEENIINTISDRLGLSNERKEYVKNRVSQKQNEVNWFFMQFGTLSHSSNVYLNAAGHVVTKTVDELTEGFLKDSKPFVDKLTKLGFADKAKEFFKNGFLQNRFNDKAREEAIADKRFEVYKEVTKLDTLTKEEFDIIYKKDQFRKLTVDQLREANQKYGDWELSNLRLTPLSVQEMRDKRERLASYSKETQDYEETSSGAYNNIMQNAEVIDGVRTFTEDNRSDMEALKKQRVHDKSIYYDGDVKKGIDQILITEQEYLDSLIDVDIDGITVKHEKGIIKTGESLYFKLLTNATREAVLSFELTQIDNNKRATNKVRFGENVIFPQKFIDMIGAMQPEEAYNFLMLNSYVGYDSKYYESLERPSILSRLEDAKDGDNDYDIDNLILKIANLSKKRGETLQANKRLNNPSEVNYDNMDSYEISSVREDSERLEELYRESRAFLKDSEIQEDDLSETIVNKSFKEYMLDIKGIGRLDYSENTALDKADKENIKDILKVVGDNSTQTNRRKIEDAQMFIKNFTSGRVQKIDKALSYIFKEELESYNNLSVEEQEAIMTNELLNYSYSRMLPYFKKSQPKGADIALEQLEVGAITASEFIDNYLNRETNGKDDYKNLLISPNFNFQDADDSRLNREFLNAKANGDPMFRTFEEGVTEDILRNSTVDDLANRGLLNKFVSKEYLKQFDIDLVELYNTGIEVSRKDTKRHEARNEFLNLQKRSIDLYGMEGSHNPYLVPQKERDRFRKVEEIVKNAKEKSVKSLLDEMLTFREDESELGQQEDEEGNTINTTARRSFGLNIIPKYGIRKLEQAVATDELLASYIWMNKQANTYRARVNNIGDMTAIEETLLGSEFEGGLSAADTNAYKMFDDFKKANFFGIKESVSKQYSVAGVTFDVGKVLKTFGGWIRLRNLGFNLTIPITSALTGSVQKRIETLVGEKVDKDASKRADKLFFKHSGDSMREIMGFESKSWLNAVGDRFGFFEYEERFNNSNYGKSVRAIGKSPYVAHQMANFPVNPRVGLAVLANNRFVEGNLIDYREFKEGFKGKSDKEVRKLWNDYKDVTDVIDLDESGVVAFDYKKIAEYLNNNFTDQEAKDFMDKKGTLLRTRVKAAIQSVDQQIATEDKSVSSRNAWFSFTNIHRGWLFLAAQTRLKNRQFSFSTNHFEEGTWRSVSRVVNDTIKDIRTGKVKNILTYMKERWENGDETTKKNIIRTGIEMAVLNGLIALMMAAIKELGDDDDDSYLFKTSSLFLMRTTNEIASTTVGLPENVYGTLENMIVGLNSIEAVTEIGDALAGDKVITRGRYKGKTERERYFLKQLPILKEYNNLFDDVDNTIKSYNYFNFVSSNSALKNLTVYPLLEEKKEE